MTVLKTPWGHFWYLVNYDREHMDCYTLDQCAAREFSTIELMLRQAFPSQLALQPYTMTNGLEQHP